MAGVFLEQVEEDAFQGRGVGAFPAGAGLAYLVQGMGLDDGVGAGGLVAEVGEQGVGGVAGSKGPAVVGAVGPGVGEVLALEAPLEPAALDVTQVLEQLKRGPAGREAAAGQFGRGQRLDLVGQAGAEIVEVADEDLGA